MFPAYAKSVQSSTNESAACVVDTVVKVSTDPSDWLKNSSFTPILGKVIFDGEQKDKTDTDDDEDDDETPTIKRRKDYSGSEDDRKKTQEKSKQKKKYKTKVQKKEKKKDKKRSDREYEEYQSRHGDGREGGRGSSKSRSGSVVSTSTNSYNPKVHLSKTGAIFLEDMYQLQPEDAFRIDRKCDVNNILYQSLYVEHVAIYRRLVTWTVGPKKISTGKDYGYRKNETVRYFSKENRMKLKTMSKRTFTEAKEAVNVVVDTGVRKETFKHGDDYLGDLSRIPLPSDDADVAAARPVVRKETGDVESLGIFDGKTLLYVKGKDVDDDEEEGEIAESKTLEELVKLRIGKLNKDLTARPHDVNLWLEMIEYQEESVPILLGGMTGRINSNSSQAKKNAAAKSVSREILEKKQAILDKALLKNPSSLGLQLLQFQLQRGLWDEQKWRHGWKRLLFNHANDVDLHLRYLKNFRSTVATFNSTDLLKEFCASFSSLRLNKEKRSVTKSTNVMLLRMEDQLIVFFLHYVHTLLQSGWVERAMASMQAVVEFNLFRPTKYSKDRLDHEDAVAVMESFWDGNLPRFGEKDARGWDDYVIKEGKHELPKGAVDGMSSNEMTSEETEIIADSLEAESKRWWKLEALRCQNQILPWRPNIDNGETEDDCEDLERLVIFEDVKPILFPVDDSDNQFDLVVHFLALLGLPSARTLLRKSSSSYHHQQHHSSIVSSADQLDPGGGIFSTNVLKGSWRHPKASHDDLRVDHQLRLEMTRNVLEQSLKRFTGQRKSILAGLLIETFLSAVLRCSLATANEDEDGKKRLKALKKAVKSSAKELLSDSDLRSSPTSIYAWISYALVEWQLDKIDESRKILDNATNMFAEAPLLSDNLDNDEETEDNCLAEKTALYRVKAELELRCCFVDDGIDTFMLTREVDDAELNVVIAGVENCKRTLFQLVGISTSDLNNAVDSAVFDTEAADGDDTDRSNSPRDSGNELTKSLLARKRLSSCREKLFSQLSRRCLQKLCACTFDCNCRLFARNAVDRIRRITDALFEVVVASSLLEYCISGGEEASKIYEEAQSRLRSFFTLPPFREESFDPTKVEPLFLYERLVCHRVKFAAWLRKYRLRLSRNNSSTFAQSLDPNQIYKRLLWLSVQQFPDNAFLCRLFLRSSTAATYASFHLHRRLHSLVRSATTPVLLFVAFGEFYDRFRDSENGSSGMWLLNMMRHSASTTWKHSILLWRQLFRMHLAVGKKSTESSTKDVVDERDPVVYLQHQVSGEAALSFYESLQFCPWAKQIYLDKVKNDFKQWEQVVDMMTEKELRVRFPIEEFKVLLEN